MVSVDAKRKAAKDNANAGIKVVLDESNSTRLTWSVHAARVKWMGSTPYFRGLSRREIYSRINLAIHSVIIHRKAVRLLYAFYRFSILLAIN